MSWGRRRWQEIKCSFGGAGRCLGDYLFDSGSFGNAVGTFFAAYIWRCVDRRFIPSFDAFRKEYYSASFGWACDGFLVIHSNEIDNVHMKVPQKLPS